MDEHAVIARTLSAQVDKGIGHLGGLPRLAVGRRGRGNVKGLGKAVIICHAHGQQLLPAVRQLLRDGERRARNGDLRGGCHDLRGHGSVFLHYTASFLLSAVSICGKHKICA